MGRNKRLSIDGAIAEIDRDGLPIHYHRTKDGHYLFRYRCPKLDRDAVVCISPRHPDGVVPPRLTLAIRRMQKGTG